MSRGQAVLLTGPAGAGKTATGMLWAASRVSSTSFLDWDSLRGTLMFADGIRSGLAYDAIMAGADSRADIGEVSARVAGVGARWFVENGVDCVLSATRLPPFAGGAAWWSEFDSLDPAVVVLLPSPEACLARIVADGKRNLDFALVEHAVREAYAQGWDRWADLPDAVVLDTSLMSLEEVVSAAQEAVQRGR